MFKPFSQYAMLLITLNAMHIASSAITFFFTYHRSQEVFFRQGEGGGEFSPRLRFFLMVRPLVIHQKKKKKKRG